jgi:hypothetical protein
MGEWLVSPQFHQSTLSIICFNLLVRVDDSKRKELHREAEMRGHIQHR